MGYVYHPKEGEEIKIFEDSELRIVYTKSEYGTHILKYEDVKCISGIKENNTSYAGEGERCLKYLGSSGGG